jgi:hypothetical protein
MLKIVVSVKDTIAEVFHDPHTEINSATAIRAFSASIKESPHKDDYSLYQIGTFDTQTGVLTPNEPLRIHSGHDVSAETQE